MGEWVWLGWVEKVGREMDFSFDPSCCVYVQELLVGKSSLEQLEQRCKTTQAEKDELDKKINFMRTDFDKERKLRQELLTKNSDLESKSTCSSLRVTMK